MFGIEELPRHDRGFQLLSEIQENIGKGEKEYAEVLSWAFERLGITYFSYVYVGYVPSEVDEAIIIGNYPPDWVKLYESSAMYRQDPIINYSSLTSTAFFWKEAVADDSCSHRIFDLSSHYGIEQGFTVPLHEPGCAFGSMHFATSRDNAEFQTIIHNHSCLLSTVSYMAHQFRPSFARKEPYRRLSVREVECLHWVAMGKTYGEIAITLGITERTVKYHAHNIMVKMEAVNIKQAMTKALRMNWI